MIKINLYRILRKAFLLLVHYKKKHPFKIVEIQATNLNQCTCGNNVNLLSLNQNNNHALLML